MYECMSALLRWEGREIGEGRRSLLLTTSYLLPLTSYYLLLPLTTSYLLLSSTRSLLILTHHTLYPYPYTIPIHYTYTLYLYTIPIHLPITILDRCKIAFGCVVGRSSWLRQDSTCTCERGGGEGAVLRMLC